MAQPRLSVVVPFYNVVDYLEECLRSIARQSLEDLEVIMVDDGSTDGSGEIAEGMADEDNRFTLLRHENRGTGASRNAGLQRVTGDYLCFVDGDDIVADNAYDVLVSSLDESGSDISCGAVRRFNSSREWPSTLHEGIFDKTRIGTHITLDDVLLGDRTVWNKVYRRSFWLAHGFVFPYYILEDAAVAVPAHVRAQKVDVLFDVVYFWREREGTVLSHTQRLFERPLLEGRMAQVRDVSFFLAGHSPELKKAYDVVALKHDVLILLYACSRVDDNLRRSILDFVRAFVAGVGNGAMAGLDEDQARYYQLALSGRISDLVELAAAQPYSTFL